MSANSRGLSVSLKLRWWLLVAVALHAVGTTQEGDSWKAIETRSYAMCPANVFSSRQVPTLCDTTSTVSSTTSSSSTSFTSSSTRSSSTTSSSTSETSLTATLTTFTETSTSSSSRSATSTDSVTLTTETSTTTVSSTSTVITTTSSSVTSSRTTSATSTSVTTTSTSLTVSSTTVSSTSSVTSTSVSSTSTTSTVSSSTTSMFTSTTSYLGTFTDTTSETSTSTTATVSTQTMTSTTSTRITQTVTTNTRSTSTTVSNTRTETSVTTETDTTSSSITSTDTVVTSTSTTSTGTSSTTVSMTRTRTSTTVVIQPCGNPCPLLGMEGCTFMQSGEQCEPQIKVDPCIDYSTALLLSCPENNVDLWHLPEPSDVLPVTRCRVCGFGPVGMDQDPRKGYYESDIFFGQNSIESMISEEQIVEYRVYLVDAHQRRLTPPLAVLPKQPALDDPLPCCRRDSYRAHIFTVLPSGYERFMVVPVSSLGTEMPAGTLSEELTDSGVSDSETLYHLGTFPPGDFSFFVHVVNNHMKAGNGSVMLRSGDHQVFLPCTRLRLLDQAVVVPVRELLMPGRSYEVLFDRECLIEPSNNESVDLVAPEHGLHFHTEDENVSDDTEGPSLLNAHATIPRNGAVGFDREFQFFFNQVAIAGPGALALVRHEGRGLTVMVDDQPVLRSVKGVPGMVIVRPRVNLPPGRYEVVFGPGAVQDTLGNMAHGSKEFEERGEWEHRVACFFGDCDETPPFGLDDYVIQVPVEGAQAMQYPDAPWASFPAPGEVMFKHENVVFEFMPGTELVPGFEMDPVVEFCSNWTTTDVCPMKRVIGLKDMLFVGSKVILNPPEDLEPGYVYNVSIHRGVVAGMDSVYADGNGRFNYSFQVAAEAVDRSPPELVAIEAICEEGDRMPNGENDTLPPPRPWTPAPMDLGQYGCGVWLPVQQISGKPPLWGFNGMATPVAFPLGATVSIRFFFREPVQLEQPGAAYLYTSETTSVKQEVFASVGAEAEDSVVTAVPELLPGHFYTLELMGVKDLATWPEPNPMEFGVALNFFTYLAAPNISMASNDGLKEVDPTSVIKLTFQGPAKLADPFSDLEAEIVQVNPPTDHPDASQRILVSDPNSVVFFGNEVLLLPSPLLAGTSYRFSLPAGAVLHFDEPVTFLFATRSEDLVPPSIVWTWPSGESVSKLKIDRTLVQIYFSEAVHPTEGRAVVLRDELGTRHFLPVDRPCPPGTTAGCIQLDLDGRRISLMPKGRSRTGEMIPWADPGRTYWVDIESDAFSDAGTVGELRKNRLPASSFSFSILLDTEGPVLFSSVPANNSGDLEPMLESILLVFDEPVEAVQSDFAVLGSSLTRPMEEPQLDMLPGEVDVNPGTGIVTLTFTVDVEAGSGFFHIWQRLDTITMRGNVSEFDVAFIKEVPVEEAIFVKNLVMFNPFPLPLEIGELFFVGSNQSAVMANGVMLAMELDTLTQADLQFRVTPTLLRVVYTSWRDWRCFAKLMDVELYMNEHLLGLNTSNHAITLRAEDGRILWTLAADEMKTDEQHLQVSLDPLVPFKATFHASHLPPHLPGGSAMPLPEAGGVFHLEVDEGLFLDRAEELQENVTVVIPVGATCGDFNYSCGPGRQLIMNASYVRCASRDGCDMDDNLTCCEDMPEMYEHEAPCLNGTNCSNDTEEDLEVDVQRRLVTPLEPSLGQEVLTYLEVFGSPALHVSFSACEIRYQDLEGRSARIYVPLEVQRSEVNGRLRPQMFEVYIPATAVQDLLGNVPQEATAISFTHDLRLPELDVSRCHPLNQRNATEQESIQLSFSEPVKAGSGFLELWDVEDATGPKVSVDVQLLADANPEFFGRKLIDGNIVSLIPDLICSGGCRQLESGVTYFLATSNAGVLYDMMDNPLPKLDTNQSGNWRFEVNENVTRAPEVLRVNYDFNMTSEGVEVNGYVYFTQRVFQNGSFPGTSRSFPEIEIRDCGANFDCSTASVFEPLVYVEPWGSLQLGLEPGVVQFRFDAKMAHLYEVTVASRGFMGAETSKGSLAGPSEPFSFLLPTGRDPRVVADRPFVLPGGVTPLGEKVPAAATVSLLFSEEIKPGIGNISFCTEMEDTETCQLGRFADGSPSTLPVESASVLRRQVLWPPQEFAFGQKLHILIPEGLFISADVRAMPMGRSSGEYSFSIREGDVVPPRVIAVEATDRPDGTVQLIFSESVLFGVGDRGSQGVIELESSEGVERFHATVEGAVVSIHGPFRRGAGYQLRQSASVLMDLMRNPVDINVEMDPENFTISDDMTGPIPVQLQSQHVSMHDIFHILFDEAVLPGQGRCELHSLPPDSCGITCGRREVLLNISADVHHYEQGGRLRTLIQVDPGQQLLPGFGYRLVVHRGFVEDLVGNPSDFTEATYLVNLQRDLTPPQLLLATINGHGGPVSFDQDRAQGLELYFSEVLRPLDATMPSVVLRLSPSDGGARCARSFHDACDLPFQTCSFPCGYVPAEQTVSIASDAIEIRGAMAVIPQLPRLEYGRGYRLDIQLDFFLDLSGNVADAAPELVFHVQPLQEQSMKELILLSSLPMDGQTMVPETSSLQLVFNLEVQAGDGDILLLPQRAEQEQDDMEAQQRRDCEGCNESLGNGTWPSEANGSNGSMTELDEEVEMPAVMIGVNHSNVSNETEDLFWLDPNVTGAIRVPVRQCHIRSGTVTCTLPLLAKGVTYRIYWMEDALQDAHGQWFPAGPMEGAPEFRVIDMPFVFPSLLSLEPSGRPRMEDHYMDPPDPHHRRLDDDHAIKPKPPWYAPKGALLAMTFSTPMKLGTGLLRLMDCSPGNALRCFDDDMEKVADEEVFRIEVSSPHASDHILLEGRTAFLVSHLLRPGARHALRLETLGIFVDEFAIPLLPTVSEFWVQADDERPPEIFMQVPNHRGEAATNSNITLFFSEALQADLSGVINISDGIQEEIIPLTSSDIGQGYVILRGSTLIINPSLDFGPGRRVTVNFEPEIFKDLAGNPFPGLMGEEYFFHTAPARFRQMARYLQYPNFREPRFTPREGALFHFVNGSLLLFSGIADGFCLADTWVSRSGEEWTQVLGVESQSHGKLFPLVAFSPSAVDKEGCIWILGGQCNNDPGTVWKTCDIGRSWFPLDRPTPIPFRGQVPLNFPSSFRDHGMTILGGWQLVVVDASPGSSESVWRFNSWTAEHVQRVAGETPLPFGLRREPKLLATSDGGLYLVGGHLCTDNEMMQCSFNDVWFSPDIGESWYCKTKNYLAKDPSAVDWPGVGRGFNAVITQDDTIFVLAGQLPGTQEASPFVYESYQGLGDIYLTDSPYFIMPGSTLLSHPPVPPQQNFTLFFGEEILLAKGAMAYFREQPGNYTDWDNETNYTSGMVVESDLMADGKDLILRPREWLLPGRRYLIRIPANHVLDAAGNAFGEIDDERFEVEVLEDFQAPYAVSMHPPNGRIDVVPWTRLTLTMSEEVLLGRGHLKVSPVIPYGVTVELPVDRAVVVMNKVIFQLPPGRRFTPDMEYVVTMPMGLLRDRFGNEVDEQICGRFKTLSGFITTSDYFGGVLPMEPRPRPDDEAFPKVLAAWPFNGATDVPARPGLEVLLYFEDEVRWTRDGTVVLANETHVMTNIPTSDHFDRETSLLELMPELFAVKIRFPPTAVLRPALRYTVTLSAGAVEDTLMGNRSDEIRLRFHTLQNALDNSGPKLVASDVAPNQLVEGSKHIFRFWYDKDIMKTTDQKPPVELEFPTGEIVEVPGESQNVTIQRNMLTAIFPEHVIGRGGMVTVRVPRFIFVDVLQRTNGMIEGGGQPAAMQEEISFMVQPEETQRPQLNISHCYPPTELYDFPSYEFPAKGRIILAFTEEVQGGSGHVIFSCRSDASKVMVPGRHAIIAGNFAMVDLALLPGEVYNVTLEPNAFLDLDGYNLENNEDPYVFSTLPLIRFRQLGSEHWRDPRVPEVPGARMGASVTVDDVNRIFLLGGRTSPKPPPEGRALNDVWLLDTFKEVNCASSYEGETPCSRQRCEVGPDGSTFTLGSQSFLRYVWRARSASGSDCITTIGGHRRSELGGIISSKSLQCPCPTCTSHPGPPDAPLPSDMINDFYVQDYVLVPSDDTRPLLCAAGMTPTGNFSCKLDSRYFAKFDTPYPTCENSSCEEPPDVSLVANFAAWDPMRSTGSIFCPNISSRNPLVHDGFCAALCDPGWQVDGVFRCQQGVFQAPSCWKQTCEISSELSKGRLDCDEYGGAFLGATCNLLCQAGYVPSNLQSTCQTMSTVPEAAPSFLPAVSCTPSSCGDYEHLTGASITYTSDHKEITGTALLNCEPGYFPAGAAFGLENPVELRCGPVVRQENEAEVEWKITYTGARAGLICAPNGMAVYDTVALKGTIQLMLNLPSTLTRDSLCLQYKERFLSDVSLALVMALSSAGQVPLDTDAMLDVSFTACDRRILSLLSGSSSRRLAIDTSVSFTVKVADDAEALQLQLAVTDAEASSVFKRVFALSLVSSSGVEATGIVTSRMTRSIIYIIDEPDGTQVSVVDGDGDNDTGNGTGNNGTGIEEDDFLSSPVFIGLVAGGSSCCCCCCLLCCYLRRRYMVDVYADFEESEEEDFSDDNIVEIPDDKDY